MNRLLLLITIPSQWQLSPSFTKEEQILHSTGFVTYSTQLQNEFQKILIISLGSKMEDFISSNFLS